MIRVLIERHIADGLAEHYDTTARGILQQAIDTHGFISGESLRNSHDPNHRLLIATFRTLQDWQLWEHSQERHDMMAKLTPMLETEEKITLFEH